MTTPAAPKIAVICTVLNEAASLDELLGSLAAQTHPPDEIVIADGGSTDGTWERLLAWQARGLPLRPLQLAGANISTGRNAAIGAAQSELIAVTDAGVRLEPDWLAALLAPFKQPDPPDVVCGFFEADPRSLFELALGATTLPTVAEIDPARFLPSSRSVAFRRQAWATAGGYPEWLDYCEDLLLDLSLKRLGCRFGWAPAAVAHFRPRPDLHRFFLQYFRYARGDGKALLWTRRHLLRYAVYSGAPALLAVSRGHPVALALLALGGLAYCRRPWLRLAPALRSRSPSEKLLLVTLVPLLRAVGDAAKMLGYPPGLLWRLRHRLG